MANIVSYLVSNKIVCLFHFVKDKFLFFVRQLDRTFLRNENIFIINAKGKVS